MIINPKSWPELSSLLDTALELPEEQRLPWLDKLDLDQVLKKQLYELLTVDRGVGNPLHKLPDFSSVLKEEAPRRLQMNIELQAGKLIGSYRLLRELGRGGMGAVWLADRVDGKFKREVALKFPYAGPHQQQLAERLIRERDILAGLQHAHIARMYDADITASGQPFLVLEYVDGIAIHQYCDEQRLNVRDRLLLFQQVLNAVRYAHSRSVIHRDIKPSNILVTADGAVHLLDFGIATLITDGEVHETPLTVMGGHLLTPEYASPEQLARLPVTTACDIYSLGVVLYELLTGASPYRYSREQRAQLEQAIANADVITPSHALISRQAAENRNVQPTQLRHTLRGELDVLLLKALKKNVDDRYASIDMLLEDIKRYLHNQPILAQPDSQWYRFRKFIQRNRVAVASVVTIMIALIAGTGIALWQAHIAKQQRDHAVASAARSEAVTKFMHLMITETADADEPVTVQTLLERTEEVTSKLMADDADQQVAVLEMLGNYYFGFDHLELAKQSFNKALSLVTKNPDPEIKARLHCGISGTYARLGDVPTAQQHINIGLAMSADFPQARIACLQARGRVKWRMGDIDGMLHDDELALSVLRSSNLVRPELSASLLAEVANAELELGHATEAERDYATSLEQLTKVGLGDRVTAMYIHSNWAAVGNYVGNPSDALMHLEKASAIERKHIGTNQAQKLSSINHALVLRNLARYEEALHEYRLGLQSVAADRDTLSVVSAELGMSITLLELGQTVEAEQLLKQAKLVVDKDLPGDAFAAQDILQVSGVFALKQRRYADAISLFSQKIQFLSEHNGIALLAHPLILRGDAYLAKNDLAAALSDATRAYNTSRSVQGSLPYSCHSGNAALLLTKIEIKLNHPDVARKWTTIAVEQLQGSLGDEHPTTIEARQLLQQFQVTLRDAGSKNN